MKTHDYNQQNDGLDYVLQSFGGETTITAYGHDVDIGDRIKTKFCTFEVQQIEYYKEPSDLFRASLNKIDEL